jgi:hypothetical protein
MKPHWYRTYIYECPLCSAGETIRERVYGKKPKDSSKRYIFVVSACGGHFV